jgi:uncharacterized damage-inducible protein DinB
MNIPQFFVKRWESEQPAFSRVLRALPAEQLSYRPHDRSTCAGDLAWQLVIEHRALSQMLDTGEVHWDASPRPTKASEIEEAWDKATSDLRQKLASLDEKNYEEPAKFFFGEHAWSDTKGNMLWSFLFDMVHHRGQLSTYIRPMGGKVPAIYGPSADATE